MTATERVSRGGFGRKLARTASCTIAWMRGLAATRVPKCAGAAMSRALFVPDSGLACAECGLYHGGSQEIVVLVVNFSGSLLLQDRVAVHSQYVVDATDTKTRGGEQILSVRFDTAGHVCQFIYHLVAICVKFHLVLHLSSAFSRDMRLKMPHDQLHFQTHYFSILLSA